MSSEEGPSFYLVPNNPAAAKVLEHPANAYCVTVFEEQTVLHLSFPDPENPRVTLGHSGCHITLPNVHGAGIHKLHCYFRYNAPTGAVILSDKSPNQSTQVFDNDQDFIVPLSKAMHSVVVTRGLNRKIFIGNKRYYKFELVWDSDPMKSFLSRFPNDLGPLRDIPDPEKVRYLRGEMLGHGAYGIVWKTVDIRDGKAMAVKRFQNLEHKRYLYAIREVNNMLVLSGNSSKRRHDHILPILDQEYDKEKSQWIELFMPLREGSVKHLIRQERDFTDPEIADLVLYQIAKALKYMEKYDMVHRDIKPDNILYETRIGADGAAYYHFELADFGLSNESALARTRAGTEMFMAPEVWHHETQSCKTDIWSLFATIVWIHNMENFREYEPERPEDLHEFLMHIAQYEQFANIRDMAARYPKYRVSARDLVTRLENGFGVVTGSEDLASGMAAMGLGSVEGEENEVAEGNANYIYSIPPEVEKQFEKVHKHSYRGRGKVHAQMDGHSAMLEFGSTYRPSTQHQGQTYLHGRVGEEYTYPRNVTAHNAAAGGEEPEEHEEEDDTDEGRDKGKGKDNDNEHGYMNYMYP